MDIRPKSFIKRVFDFARAELDKRVQPVHAEPSQEPRPRPAPFHAVPSVEPTPEPSPSSPTASSVLEIARTERGALRVCWSVAEGEVARSASLIDDEGVLCLRLVSFAAGRVHVVREVQDRPSVPLQGECEIARPDGRAVVALGLRAQGRFVSIAHHVV